MIQKREQLRTKGSEAYHNSIVELKSLVKMQGLSHNIYKHMATTLTSEMVLERSVPQGV